MRPVRGAVTAWFVLAALTAAGISGPVRADSIFVKIEGVKGSSTTVGHVGEIPALSFQFGVTNSGSAATGTRTRTAPTFSEIVITKQKDASSPALLSRCLTGKSIPEVVITFAKTTASRPVDYYTLILKDAVISSVSTSAAESVPTESVSMLYSAIRWKYLVQDEKGSLKSGDEGGWNLAESKALTSPVLTSGAPTASTGRLGIGIFTGGAKLPAVQRMRSLDAAHVIVADMGIKGESTIKGYEGKIKLTSLSFGAAAARAGAASRESETAPVTLSEIAAAKQLDSASTKLMLRCADGGVLPTAVLTVMRSDQSPTRVLVITLTNARVTSYSQSSGGDGRPAESFTLAADKVMWEYFETDQTGKEALAGRITYNAALAK